MQRRAAVVSVAIFLVFAVGSYTLLGAAEQPSVSLDDPEYSITQGEQRVMSGTEYTFSEVSAQSATATWENESARYTETWSANDSVAVSAQNYTVRVTNASVGAFELREVQSVDRPTVERNGTTYVIVPEGETQTLVPREEYLPEQDVLAFSVGDAVTYDGNDNETAVASVSESAVTVEWFAPRTNELEFGSGETTEVQDTEYTAYIESGSSGEPVLELTTDHEDYASDVEAQEYFAERMDGLRGVTIFSGAAAVLLVMFSFLPSRY
ncbi:hypothetical protein PNQ29_01235 [Halobacterium salinarum]|uniref:hypothetical protein n=1 Tax=Halobacterium salinarum TaxID=2242 RepID=UPI0025525038|nr:hypothetical protein [Halobacterium salinarum]MDL0118379.1 hypothetical protein [Halobacterium salinarum]